MFNQDKDFSDGVDRLLDETSLFMSGRAESLSIPIINGHLQDVLRFNVAIARKTCLITIRFLDVLR